MDQHFFIDRASFEQLYNSNWEKLYLFACKILQDEELAKEVIQDIFKSIWERRNTLQIQEIDHYLIRAVKMQTFTILRNRQKHQIHHQEIGLISSKHYTEESIYNKELADKIQGLIGELPKQCKHVFQLSRDQGLSNRQISQELLISERAVEYHISKALNVLRTELVEYINL